MRQGRDTKPQSKDRPLFLFVCLYWLSQTFLIPLVPIGPSWAVWPTFSDLAVLAMVPLVLYRSLGRTYEGPTRTILTFVFGVLFLCTVSFLFATGFYGSGDSLVTNGAYQIYRLLEFLVVFLATAQMTMDLPRWRVFRVITLSAFCLISAGVLLTSGLVNTSALVPFIPLNSFATGPWVGYTGSGQIHQGSGFISYNHGYTGMQLILSGGVAYLCFEQSRRVRLLICSLLLVSTFVSGSRAGLITALALVLVLEWKRPKSNLLALLLLCAFGGLFAIRSTAAEDMVERQSSSVSSMDEDGFSGRTNIWQEHLDYFAAHPLNIVLGTGFGFGGKASSKNAHLLYLQVMTETGLAGLLVFLYLQRSTLLLLQEPKLRTMRFTVWALLISGLTQETLYPVVSFSQFLGFYLSALVIALRFTKGFDVVPSFLATSPVNSMERKKSAPAR